MPVFYVGIVDGTRVLVLTGKTLCQLNRPLSAVDYL